MQLLLKIFVKGKARRKILQNNRVAMLSGHAAWFSFNVAEHACPVLLPDPTHRSAAQDRRAVQGEKGNLQICPNFPLHFHHLGVWNGFGNMGMCFLIMGSINHN